MSVEKVWIGGAPAKAKQVKYTLPIDIESGQVLKATIGMKSLSYTFPDGPLRKNVVAAFAALWGDMADSVTEFAQVNITDNSDGSFTLTAETAGVPFIVSILIGDGTNEKQVVSLVGNVTGGTFTLDFDGQETGNIAYDATANDVQTELEGLSNIEVGDVEVTGDNGGPWTIEFKGNLSDKDVAVLIADGSLLESTNEQQTVSLASCSGGTFTLEYEGDTTDPIAHNASATTVESELEALPSIGAGNVSVSGSGPWVVEFTGTLRGTNVDLITLDGSNLTGVLDATTSETTPGGNGVNERWLLRLDQSGSQSDTSATLKGNASTTGGTFDIAIDIDGTVIMELDNIPYDVTLAELQELIENAPRIKSGGNYANEVCVWESASTGTGQLSDGDTVYIYVGPGADYSQDSVPDLTLTVDSTNLTGANYSTLYDGNVPEWGTGYGDITSFYIQVGDQTTDDLDAGATVATVKAAIEGLSNVGAGNVSLVKSDSVKSFTWLLQFVGDLASQDTGLTLNIGSNSESVNTFVFEVIDGSGGTSEVQTLSISGSPVSGTFALRFDLIDTALLNYNSTAAEVQTALEGLLGAGNVTCSGGDLPGADVVVTFAGSKAGINMDTIEVIFGIVTETVQGGGDPGVNITTTQTILSVTTLQESEGPNDWNTAANWDTGTLPENGNTVRVPNGPNILYGLDQSDLSLALFIVEDSDTQIGLPRRTDVDEIEYLPRFLKLAADEFVIGVGTRGGSERIYLEPVNDDAKITVHQSQSGPDDEEAVLIRNVNATNTATLTVLNGQVGIATNPKDEAYFAQIIQRGGYLSIGSNVGLGSGGIEKTGGFITAYQATLNGMLTL